MSEKRPASLCADDSLLSAKERVACQAIAAGQTGLVSQRAAGLLALAEGGTQSSASELSGLTVGQIRYLLTIFRRKGMTIFPVDKTCPSSSVVDASQFEAHVLTDLVAEEDIVHGSKKEKEKPAAKKKGNAKGAGQGQDKKTKDKKDKKKSKKKKKDKTKKAK